jgi:NitT/TauT family transport system substrate-binding protein
MLVAAGCGSSGQSGAQPGGPGSLTTISVGVSPSASVAPVYIAQQRGYFREQGLNVKPVVAQSGAVIVPQLLRGQLQFGLADTVGAITAIENGVALKLVAVATVGSRRDDDDSSGLVVKDPSLTVARLAGKTIAINQIKGGAELVAEAAIDAKGGDSRKVKFVEVPFPDMQNVVSSGRADGAVVNEPFLTAALTAKLKTMLSPQAAAAQGLPLTTYAASAQYAGQHGDIVRRFQRALTQAAVYARTHPQAVRQVTSQHTTLPPSVVAHMRLFTYPTDARNTDGVGDVARLMAKYGIVPKVPPLSQLVLPSGS